MPSQASRVCLSCLFPFFLLSFFLSFFSLSAFRSIRESGPSSLTLAVHPPVTGQFAAFFLFYNFFHAQSSAKVISSWD